jgi:hypothetical protein
MVGGIVIIRNKRIDWFSASAVYLSEIPTHAQFAFRCPSPGGGGGRFPFCQGCKRYDATSLWCLLPGNRHDSLICDAMTSCFAEARQLNSSPTEAYYEQHRIGDGTFSIGA